VIAAKKNRLGGLIQKLRIDPYMLALVGMVLLASLLPASGGFAVQLGLATKLAVGLLFFLHGARLSPQSVGAALVHWRAHLTILAISFALFPLIGLGASHLPTAILPASLAQGVLFLCCLPSTVQSAIAFTAVARGNVAAAVVAASASNLVGIIVTPVLVGLLMHAKGGSMSWSAVEAILLQLFLPFALGQALRPWIGGFVARHKASLTYLDRGSILLIVYSAFSNSVTGGLWSKIEGGDLLRLLLVCLALLGLVLALSTLLTRTLGFSKQDEIAIVFAGSKKSLATGVPMAGILFSAGTAGMIVLPLMIYHQIQLMACAFLAQRYGNRPDTDPDF
jgi:sodium/bile acid cotransporter 7